MKDLTKTTVADIVLDHPRTAKVFQKHKIDFCCGGQITIDEACRKRAIAPADVIADVRAEIERGDAQRRDPRTLSTQALVAYIVERHHGYLRSSLPPIAQMMAKVARVHGARGPALVEMNRVFEDLAATLERHIDDEEESTFPRLLAERTDAAVIARELAAMRREHVAVGDALGRLRALADDYRLPDWACATYRSLFAELQALEADVFEHVHLENNVLAPRFERPSA